MEWSGLVRVERGEGVGDDIIAECFSKVSWVMVGGGWELVGIKQDRKWKKKIATGKGEGLMYKSYGVEGLR